MGTNQTQGGHNRTWAHLFSGPSDPLFSSLSCSHLQMGGGAHLSKVEDLVSLLKQNLTMGRLFPVTHTDERKLQTQSYYGWCQGQR